MAVCKIYLNIIDALCLTFRILFQAVDPITHAIERTNLIFTSLILLDQTVV